MGNTSSTITGSKIGEHLVAPQKGNPIIDHKSLRISQVFEELSQDLTWYEKSQLQSLLKSNDMSMKSQLRKYIHRDIFTSYELENGIPEDIQFGECYLLERDGPILNNRHSQQYNSNRKRDCNDIYIKDEEDHQELHKKYKQLSHHKLAQLNAKYYQDKYEYQKENSSTNSNPSDCSSSNDMYSPPSSTNSCDFSSEIRQDNYDRVEELVARNAIDETINRLAIQEVPERRRISTIEPIDIPPGISAGKTTLTRSRSKSLSSLPAWRAQRLSRGISTRQVCSVDYGNKSDFDFLNQRDEIYVGKTIAKDTADTHQQQSKDTVIYETDQIYPRSEISAINSNNVILPNDDLKTHHQRYKTNRFRGSNLVAAKDDNHTKPLNKSSVSGTSTNIVEAGIPPKVPSHKVGVSPNLATGVEDVSWRAGHQPSTSDDSWIKSKARNCSNSPEIYTRKCSYLRRKHSTLGSIDLDKEDQDTIIQSYQTGDSMDSDRNVDSHYKMNHTESIGRKFMLPGYDQEKKLQVVNRSRGDSSQSSTPLRETQSKESLSNGRNCVSMYEPALPRNPAIMLYDERNSITGSYFSLELLNSDSDARRYADQMWSQRGEGFLAKVSS